MKNHFNTKEYLLMRIFLFCGLFLSIIMCPSIGHCEHKEKMNVLLEFQFLYEDGACVQNAFFSQGEIYPHHRTPVATQCNQSGKVNVSLPVDSKENFSWLWIQFPGGEMTGISLEKWMNGGAEGRQLVEYRIPRSTRRKVSVFSTSHPELLAGAKVLFWRNKSDSLYCFSGEINCDGVVNASLLPDEEYSVCVFTSINTQEYAYASQISWNSSQGCIGIEDWHVNSKSCDGKFFQFFPFFDGIYPFVTNVEAMIQEAAFQSTSFPQLPSESLFCVFYEGQEGYDLVGPNGTLAFTAEQIQTIPNPEDPEGERLEIGLKNKKRFRLNSVRISPKQDEEVLGEVEFHIQNRKESPRFVFPFLTE